MPRLRIALSFLLVALLLPAAGFGADCQGVSYGAETPEALIAGLQDAARDADMGQLARYLSDSDRAKAGLGLTIGATMMLAMREMGLDMNSQGESDGDDATKKKADLGELQTWLGSIFDKYGVEQPDQETMGRMMRRGPEGFGELEDTMKGLCTAELIGELATFLSEVSEQEVSKQIERFKADDVGPVTVDGDTARSAIGGEELLMTRIDGRWYVDIESTSPGVGPG
ncbi:MAG: hypothetical protein MPN21_08435 [Thermoanaerobaculia bacterium]|nr:hypothetical protein [Thermoanaerobaculia bacterium]